MQVLEPLLFCIVLIGKDTDYKKSSPHGSHLDTGPRQLSQGGQQPPTLLRLCLILGKDPGTQQ